MLAAPLPGRAAPLLTNAFDVLGLSATNAAKGLPILVTGVVTAAQNTWGGRFFVQDASGGVFVENLLKLQPTPGDLVEVSGVSHPGGYAPIIKKPHWKKIGVAPLPEAKPVTIERLMSGSEDSQRVEISGVVRTAQAAGTYIAIEIASAGYRIPAYLPSSSNVDVPSLVGSVVVLRGTVAASFNAKLRRILTVTLYVPRLDDFIVKAPGPTHPFDEPLTPLDGIAQYRRDSSPGNQVHVKGVVTYQRMGQDLFLQDQTGGLQVKTKLAAPVYPGDTIEAVGFPAIENFLPVLEDAVFRKSPEPLAPSPANKATVTELQKGLHHAGYVTLQGRLIDRVMRSAGKADRLTELIVQTTNVIFVAEKEGSPADSFFTDIPPGSLIEASGICLLQPGDDGKVRSFRLLLPSAADVRVIAKPSWLTPRHLLVSLSIVFAVLFVAIGWIVMVARKNSILKSLVQEKEAAQRELQQAHGALEQRVKERTAQLKIEMTTRKESELQFRAVLTERTRLAQELHDTLEQTMTGIALQLDIVAGKLEKIPGSAAHHLKLARGLMRRSQMDLRRSVWGLRSRADQEFNLANALITSSRQITGDTGIHVEFETFGKPYALSEVVEENLLRIGLEAVTNAVKYSEAALIKIELRFAPNRTTLQISDDGNGFDPQACAGPKEGHFGLLGIRERTERLGGQVLITSAPGFGATIRVEIRSEPANGAQTNQPAIQSHEERV